MNWLDYLLVAGIVVGCLDGFKRGLIPVVFRFLGSLVALAAAIFLAGRVAELLDTTLSARLHISEWLGRHVTAPALTAPPSEPLAALPFSDTVHQWIASGVSTGLQSSLIPAVTNLTLLAAGFLLVLIGCRIVFAILEAILDRLVVAGLGQGGSRMLGVIAGFGEAALSATIGLSTLYAAAAIPPLGFLAGWIEGSTLAKLALSLTDSVWPLISAGLSWPHPG